MSRGPLDVLRDMRADAACSAPTCKECKEYDEAIAQVEALVLAVRRVTNDRHYFDAANSPDGESCGKCGHNLRNVDFHFAGDDNSATDKRHLVDALQPFTPGQDSEGGGHGR